MRAPMTRNSGASRTSATEDTTRSNGRLIMGFRRWPPRRLTTTVRRDPRTVVVSRRGGQRLKPMIKRPFDLVVSSVALVLLAPLFLVIGALIKLDSPGPVFYMGTRVGRHGRPFHIFKFRTMVRGA